MPRWFEPSRLHGKISIWNCEFSLIIKGINTSLPGGICFFPGAGFRLAFLSHFRTFSRITGEFLFYGEVLFHIFPFYFFNLIITSNTTYEKENSERFIPQGIFEKLS